MFTLFKLTKNGIRKIWLSVKARMGNRECGEWGGNAGNQGGNAGNGTGNAGNMGGKAGNRGGNAGNRIEIEKKKRKFIKSNFLFAEIEKKKTFETQSLVTTVSC